MVLTLDTNGAPRIGQFLLPIGHLIDGLEPQVRDSIRHRYGTFSPEAPSPLKDVLRLAQLSRAFRRRLNIRSEFGSAALEELLYGKWLDPIGAALVAYECLRRDERQNLSIVSSNMKRYFAGLPDSNAIACLSGTSREPLRGVPLFLDGLAAYEETDSLLPYPWALVDYSGPWTAWRGAMPEQIVKEHAKLTLELE